jgi:hypothetical protein
MYRMVLISLLICNAARTGLAESLPADWKALCEQAVTLGIPADRVDQALGRCHRNGMSVADTEALFRPVCIASAESLSADYVFLKIEEGLAKQVDAARVTAAAESRLANLRQAKKLVSGDGQQHGGGYQHLTMRTCMALESGLPAEVLQNILSRSGRVRYGRMVHVIDAGGTLYLAGLPPSNIQQIMNDCLDRDLSGPEILRVIDMVLQGHREGKSFESIYATLWIPTN